MAQGEKTMDRSMIMTKSKTLLGVSLLALTLAACGGDDQTASSPSGGSDGLWTWSSPDAWYESSGPQASAPAPAPAQPQQTAPAQAGASSSMQASASAPMTTRTYEVEEVDPITGRVSRRTVTESVPAAGQASAGATMTASAAPTVTASAGGTVIPAGKLPQNALPPSGFGSADTQNANYSGSVRGSMTGSVSGAPAAAPTAVVDAGPAAMPQPVSKPQTSSPDVLLPSGMAGSTGMAASRPLVTSPAAAAAGRSSGGFDTDYLDLENGSTQRFTREPGMSVTERMEELETEVVMDYDARWSDLEFDGGAMRGQQHAMNAPQATMPYTGGQSMAAAMTSTIPFAAGSVNLSTTDRRRILEAVVAHQSRGGTIEVIGHAASPNMDRSGATSGYDLALARANKVGKALVDAGVPASAIRLLVMGATGQAKVDIVLR